MSSPREPQYITLQEWAARKFSKPPHVNTLRRWADDGTIQPVPVKMGRDFYVVPTARHVNEPPAAEHTTGNRLVDRVRAGGLSTRSTRHGLKTA